MNDYVFIDFDGVILDTEKRMYKRKEDLGFCDHDNQDEFRAYFEYTNLNPEEWDYIIRGAHTINNSVEIIQELEKMKKRIAILTKVNSLYEMKVKIDDLRNNRKINCPVFFTPPKVKKHHVIIPNGQLLIDDFSRNVNGWIESGGKGLIFDPTLKKDTKEKVKSLEFLLKK